MWVAVFDDINDRKDWFQLGEKGEDLGFSYFEK